METYSSDHLNLFLHPARILVSGFSNSGKSELVHRLIIKYHTHFKKIVICGIPSHPLQEHKIISNKVSVSPEIINPLDNNDPFDSKGILFIIDDSFIEAVKNKIVVDCFTKGRHNNISTILITQNLFLSGKYARNISLNASHFILLRQRDLSQIQCLGRQLFGSSNSAKFLQIYQQVVFRKPYSYLLVDLSINTPESLQFRSNIVNEPPGELVFQWQSS